MSGAKPSASGTFNLEKDTLASNVGKPKDVARRASYYVNSVLFTAGVTEPDDLFARRVLVLAFLWPQAFVPLVLMSNSRSCNVVSAAALGAGSLLGQAKLRSAYAKSLCKVPAWKSLFAKADEFVYRFYKEQQPVVVDAEKGKKLASNNAGPGLPAPDPVAILVRRMLFQFAATFRRHEEELTTVSCIALYRNNVTGALQADDDEFVDNLVQLRRTYGAVSNLFSDADGTFIGATDAFVPPFSDPASATIAGIEDVFRMYFNVINAPMTPNADGRAILQSCELPPLPEHWTLPNREDMARRFMHHLHSYAFISVFNQFAIDDSVKTRNFQRAVTYLTTGDPDAAGARAALLDIVRTNWASYSGDAAAIMPAAAAAASSSARPPRAPAKPRGGKKRAAGNDDDGDGEIQVVASGRVKRTQALPADTMRVPGSDSDAVAGTPASSGDSALVVDDQAFESFWSMLATGARSAPPSPTGDDDAAPSVLSSSYVAPEDPTPYVDSPLMSFLDSFAGDNAEMELEASDPTVPFTVDNFWNMLALMERVGHPFGLLRLDDAQWNNKLVAWYTIARATDAWTGAPSTEEAAAIWARSGIVAMLRDTNGVHLRNFVQSTLRVVPEYVSEVVDALHSTDPDEATEYTENDDVLLTAYLAKLHLGSRPGRVELAGPRLSDVAARAAKTIFHRVILADIYGLVSFVDVYAQADENEAIANGLDLWRARATTPAPTPTPAPSPPAPAAASSSSSLLVFSPVPPAAAPPAPPAAFNTRDVAQSLIMYAFEALEDAPMQMANIGLDRNARIVNRPPSAWITTGYTK